MRSLVLITAAMVLFGGSSTLAQQVRTTSTRNAPASGITSPTTPTTSSVPGTIPTPGASPLGAIQFMPGTAATISGAAMGTVMPCPTTGIAAAAPSTTVSASSADPTTGMLAPQLPPGATAPAISSFGTSVTTGACNAVASTTEATEALGNSVTIAPIPGLATITGPAFSDATIPSAATEAGGESLSPQIIVPTPDSSPAP
jgi:glucose/arabinose dehydrogenase